MILIEINLKLNIRQLEAVVSAMRYRLMSLPHILVNGKSEVSREQTLRYQMTLKLTEKLAKKLVDKQLNPPKKKEFKVKLNYPEAYTLHSLLFEVETPEQVAVYLQGVFSQLDKVL